MWERGGRVGEKVGVKIITYLTMIILEWCHVHVCVHVPLLQEGTTSIATQTEPPPRGVSDLWGLDEEIDKWQVSAMPEEKQYFSMDVS